MKTAFFHDTRFKVDKDGIYYTSNGLTKDLFEEYFQIFNKLSVVARAENIDDNIDKKKYSISSHKDVTFNCIKKLSIFSLIFGKDRQLVNDEIGHSDFIIIRMPSIIGIIAYVETLSSKKPYLIEMVGCPWDSLWNYGKLKYKLAAPILFIINKYMIRAATNVIYVSSEFLQRRYPNKHNNIGVSDVKIDNANGITLKNRFNKLKKNSSKTIYKIGLIGSLDVNFKGHETAIKALSILKGSVKFELHFLGSGNKGSKNIWTNLAEKYNIENYLFFDGTLPSGRPVFEWLDDIDIYLIPSLQEGLPRALIEAMSRASVCAGVKTGGIPELLDSSVVVNKKDYKALADVIFKLIKDTDFALNQAQRNFHIAKKYNKEQLAKKRIGFYRKLNLSEDMK